MRSARMPLGLGDYNKWHPAAIRYAASQMPGHCRGILMSCSLIRPYNAEPTGSILLASMQRVVYCRLWRHVEEFKLLA